MSTLFTTTRSSLPFVSSINPTKLSSPPTSTKPNSISFSFTHLPKPLRFSKIRSSPESEPETKPDNAIEITDEWGEKSEPEPENPNCFTSNRFSAVSSNTIDYEFTDGGKEVELKLRLRTGEILSPKDISVDADGTSLSVKQKRSGSLITLLETTQLFEKIVPSETIWYIDEDQLVVNMKKVDGELKWPDVVESWESLTAGMMQLLKGASIYIVGDSTEVNQKVSRELAVGLGYSPLDSMELLESFAKQTIDSWILAEGPDSVAEAESSVFESLSSHVRTVVSTLGGRHGAAGRADKWRHLYSGFTVWISQTEATDEESAKEEAMRNKQEKEIGYSHADVVVKLQGWDPTHAKSVAQASLSALKQLIISDKALAGKKSLYIRLGCRGDWPNIKPPGWDPSTNTGESSIKSF